ncbi:GGDEF domain-containing protein [Hahella aquimaris]|uniref:GGDEF domain-containing protein n=1 Tax=Hahella sp. HNIBRBA332 TaxID=3015983 RepID=UPI00273B90C9|nr:GGDEF domain-containing protein [Hahella sp. HNIBRBA332]WLQ16340.1 GGDEF domain-containing protein [Hahella sp. HNIBRBA332]
MNKLATNVFGAPSDTSVAMRLIRKLAGEDVISREEWRHLYSHTVGSEYSAHQYLMRHLTGRQYSETDSIKLWNGILHHKVELTCALDRDPGFFVAALDYLSNKSPKNGADYILVAEDVLIRCMEMSLVDGLTGLFNRNAAMKVMEKTIEGVRRKNGCFALLMMDVDDFSEVNSEFGHIGGDEVLVQIAQIINQSVRGMDIVGRYGGDEFVALLPEADSNVAIEVAERIRRAVESNIFKEKQVTISIGVAVFEANGASMKEYIQAADEMLYKVKHNAKNSVLISSIYRNTHPLVK